MIKKLMPQLFGVSYVLFSDIIVDRSVLIESAGVSVTYHLRTAEDNITTVPVVVIVTTLPLVLSEKEPSYKPFESIILTEKPLRRRST